MLDPTRRPTVPSTETEVETPAEQSNYSRDELQYNRSWIRLVTAAILVITWAACLMGRMPISGAIALSVIVAICALGLWAAFAGRNARKLDETSTGMGKDVHPTTMGTVVGYLNDGFTE